MPEKGKGNGRGIEPKKNAAPQIAEIPAYLKGTNSSNAKKRNSVIETQQPRARAGSALAKVPSPGAKNKPQRPGSVIVNSTSSLSSQPTPPPSLPSSAAKPKPSSLSSASTKASALATAASSGDSQTPSGRGSTLEKRLTSCNAPQY